MAPRDERDDMIKGYFASLPADQFPNTLALLERLFACDLEERFEFGLEERFEFGLEVLVRGLAAASES